MVVDCADVFSKNEETILAGEFRGTLVDNMNPRLKDAYAKCSATAWNKIYCAPEVVDIELAGNRIITYLLDTLMDAVMNPDKNYSRLLLNIIPRGSMTLPPPHSMKEYKACLTISLE